MQVRPGIGPLVGLLMCAASPASGAPPIDATAPASGAPAGDATAPARGAPAIDATAPPGDLPECPKCDVPAWRAALLALTDPENEASRAAAAEILGASGDPQAAASLIYSVRYDPSASVRAAANSGLGRHRGGAVEAALTASLANTSEETAVRQAAVVALAAQGTETGAHSLWVSRNTSDAAVAREVQAALTLGFPELWARWSAAEPPTLDQKGRWLLVPMMGLHGGYFMTSLAGRAGGDPGALAFSGGAILGATTPYLLTLHRSHTLADATWLSSTTTWGLASGLMTAGAVGAEGDATITWSSLGGQVAGLGLGLLTLGHQPFTAGELAYADVAGVLGGLAGLGGVLASSGHDDAQTSLGAAQLGSLVGLVGGALVAPRLDLSDGDHATLAASTTAGGFWGFFVPDLLLGSDTEARHSVGGLFIGSAVGLAGGSLLSQFSEPTPSQVAHVSLGALYGTSVLGGSGLLPSDELSDRGVSSLVLLGGIVGAGVTAWSTDGRPYGGGDAAALGVGTAWGLWQGAGFGSLGQRRATQIQGATLLGAGLGGASGMVAAHAFDPDALAVGMSAGGGVWGGWLTGWGAYVAQKHGADLSDDNVLLATLLGSDAGLLLTGLALSPALQANPERVGYIDLGGLVGMGLGTSIAAVFTDDVAEGNLVGSAVGLIGGAIATAAMDFGPSDGQAGGSATDGLVWWPQLVVEPTPEGDVRRMLRVTIQR